MKELLKQALSELSKAHYFMINMGYDDGQDERQAVIDKLDEELAKPEPEPVAWMSDDADVWVDTDRPLFHPEYSKPLYASPPVREPLSDNLIEEEHNLNGRDNSHIGLESFNGGVLFAEKHHKIGKKK